MNINTIYESGNITMISLALAIFILVAKYRVFVKAGEEGWKSIIPFYNIWTECKIVGLSTNWVYVYIVYIVAKNFNIGIITFIPAVLSLYFFIIKGISLAKSFGKGVGFGVGLTFLAIIFLPILAFGGAQYEGAIPAKDKVFKNNNTTPAVPKTLEDQILYDNPNMTDQQKMSQNGEQPQIPQSKFCTSCGAKIDGDSKFCTSCGKQVM